MHPYDKLKGNIKPDCIFNLSIQVEGMEDKATIKVKSGESHEINLQKIKQAIEMLYERLK